MFEINKDILVHFIGIGGIGMSGIAEVLISLGYSVSGSDIVRSANVERLEGLGAKVFIGHAKENIKDVTVVVHSSAVTKTNPEFKAARAGNIPIMRRAEMLAELMRLKKGLAIGGTHGKTTTTSFLATILQESRFEPTYIIGGIVDNLKGHAKVGSGDFLVAEADESDGSFLQLNPIMSVITNIDNDHMDFYKTEEKLLKAFEQFANKIPFYGVCALNIHDKRSMDLIEKMRKPYITFGIKDSEEAVADFEARNVAYDRNATQYDLYYKGKFKSVIKIQIPGRHNVLNSLGAICLAYNMKVPFEKISSGIQKFNGVGRRFESIYTKKNLEVIDDYGHHPTEIEATLQTAKDTRGDEKLVVIFEPHRFTRTRDCWDSFLHCFNRCHKLYLMPVYSASEEEIPGITSTRLAEDINHLHPELVGLLKDDEDLSKILNKEYDEKTTVIVLGAGSIGRRVKKCLS